MKLYSSDNHYTTAPIIQHYYNNIKARLVLIVVHRVILTIATITFKNEGEDPTYGINGSFVSPEKEFSVNFPKGNTKFCLSFHYNADSSYLSVNGREIFKFKASNENVNFPTQFCLRNISNGFCNIESKEISLNGNVYNIPVNYNSIDKSDILNIYRYLMT